MQLLRSYVAAGVVLLTAFITEPADAWVAQRSGGAYVGVGDLITFNVYYGLRAYSNAVAAAGTQPLARIRNTTTNELCDVLVAMTGGIGLTSNCSGAGAGQTVSDFCGAVDCAVHTLYDQLNANACVTSTTCNVVQTTNANQPALSASDSYRVLITTGNTSMKLVSANNYSNGSTNPMTLTAVGQKNGQFLASFVSSQGNQGAINGITGSPTTWQLIGTGNNTTISLADNAWHSIVGVINGAGASGLCASTSCAAYAGTATIPNTAGKPTITTITNVAAVEKWREAGWATNHAATAGEASAINSNTSAYWGFTPP